MPYLRSDLKRSRGRRGVKMKAFRWIALSVFVLRSGLSAMEKPQLPHALDTPTHFDSRLGFVAASVVFVTDTKPPLEAAGMHRFDLIEARETVSGRKSVRDSSDFKMFMRDVLSDATDSVSQLHVLRYEDVGVYRPDTLDFRLPKEARGVPVGAWILGVVITAVQPGGLAEAKGVEPGYFIEAVNGDRGGARNTAAAMLITAQEAIAQGKPLELLLVKWRPLPKS